MEDFLKEIEAFARRTRVVPQTVLYYAANRNSKTWGMWLRGESSPTYRTIEKIRNYMRENEPAEEDAA